MRAAISLLVLLLSMCGVQTESQGTDVSTELKELRDMAVELKGRLVASEAKVEALERALQDTKAEMKTEVDNLKKENAAQEAELTAVKTRLAATETEVGNLTEIREAPKVAFSAGLLKYGEGFGLRELQSGRKNQNLVFNREITNVGEAYNSTSGFFTAPVRGVYYFRFTVMDKLDERAMDIRMDKNGEWLMWLSDYDTDKESSYLSSGLALELEKGDTVNLVLPGSRRLKDRSGSNYCTFSGFLLFPL